MFIRGILLILFGLIWFAPIESKAQVSCGAVTTKQAFAGGYWVQRTCNGRTVEGVGSTLSQATTNLNGFVALVPIRACRASNSDPGSAFPGGFLMRFQCTDPYGSGYFVAGVGSSATDAGSNALSLAQLYTATNDIACNMEAYDINAYVGGYKATAQCNRAVGYTNALISGVGSTVTDLGLNIREFAELAASGNSCIMTGPMERSGLLFRAFFQCTKGVVTGYGATATEAGEDALMQASWM